MAFIKTTDGQKHFVQETKEEIDNIMCSAESISTGIVKLNSKNSISSFKGGNEKIEQIIEPTSFLRSNIIMYF